MSAAWRSVTLLPALPALVLPLISVAALLASLLPAFHWTEAQAVASPWRTLLAAPGLARMLTVTLTTGLAATGIAVVLVLIFVCCSWRTRLWRLAPFLLPPLLCVPHTALATGVTFLLSPSVLLGRLVASGTGQDVPPDLLTINDPWGLSLILTLVLKEAPFLALMALSACRQLPVDKWLAAGQSLGYSPLLCWLKIVWPPVYRALKLPLLTALIYSLSVVDISIMTGPGLPPTLPVHTWLWYQDADPALQAPAAAAVATLVLLVALGTGCFLALEGGIRYALRSWMTAGQRHWPRPVAAAGRGLWLAVLTTSLACLVLVALWSFVAQWPFPELLPSGWSLKLWQRYWDRLGSPVWTTLILALCSALLAVVLAVALLEFGRHLGSRLRRLVTLAAYVPLLIPQMALLPGIQTWLVRWNLDGSWPAVIGCHLLFVFPYCYLSLSDSWRSYDRRYSQVGRLLSGSGLKTALYVQLPLLLPALLASLLLGASVSAALYLPTLMAGAGRFASLTTEAVTLSGGGNRSLQALYALVQILPPLAIMLAARLLASLAGRRVTRSAPPPTRSSGS